MIDISLIISCVVFAVLLSGVICVTMLIYSHPDDRNQAYLPKIVVFMGLFFSAGAVFLIPLDVANSTVNGGIDMWTAWAIAIIGIMVLMLAAIPFAFWFYESEMDSSEKVSSSGWKVSTQFASALTFTGILIAVFGITLGVMYAFLNSAAIPIQRRTLSWNFYATEDKWNDGLNVECIAPHCADDEISLMLRISFPVFCMAIFSFLGWFFFIIFAGVGLPSLPVDLINIYRTRPLPMDKTSYVELKRKIGDRAIRIEEFAEKLKQEELTSVGKKTSRKLKKLMKVNYNKLELAAHKLKRDFLHLETAYVLKGGNPIWYWSVLLFGIVGGSISLFWVLHICLYMLPTPPYFPLINNLLLGLNVDGFNLFSTACFTFFSFWLLMCVIKGNFRVGLRIPLLMRIYPMEHGNTLMNSFLVNTWLICVCSFTVVQFCAMAFPLYCSNTTVSLIWGVQIKYLQFFRYFFKNNVFLWILVIFTALSMLYLICNPTDKQADIEQELAAIMKADEKEVNIKAKTKIKR